MYYICIKIYLLIGDDWQKKSILYIDCSGSLFSSQNLAGSIRWDISVWDATWAYLSSILPIAQFMFTDNLAFSRLSVSGDNQKSGVWKRKGEVGRACKHCFKNLIPVYQLLAYLLIAYFWEFTSTPCLFVQSQVTLNMCDKTQWGLSGSTSKECRVERPAFLTYFYFRLSGNQCV